MSHFYLDIHKRRIDSTYNRLTHFVVRERTLLDAEIAVTTEPIAYGERLDLKYRPIKIGEGWGENFACAWVHVTGTVPEAWKGKYVTLNLDFGGEIMLFDAMGSPLVGLTNGSVFDLGYQKDHYHFLQCAQGGEKIDFWIDAGANGLFGLNRLGDPAYAPGRDPHGQYSGVINNLSACVFDYDTWQLLLDIHVLRNIYNSLPEKTARQVQLVRSVSKALDLLPQERGGVKAVREALAKTAFAVPANPASIHVTAIGHAHIDTAWLWPFRETRRKVARTWSSQIGLIQRYPGFKFGASQAQLYKFCKEDYPGLYEKIKKAVADKDWEIQGGMWVEADCNIPSGESLVRQFLYGERFFRDEFGVMPRNLWLPDVFGYSGNLPQILKICGIDFFLTQKLSWNKYNKFPHNTFIWQGIDGSKVLSHFPPEDTYNSDLLPGTLVRHENNNAEAGIIDEAISLFGMGDGGGGPKEEQIEYGLRERDLNGCPRVEFGFAAEALGRMAACAEDLDTWVGELYFEQHRATLTTQARQKRLNRRAEEALRAAEMLCASAQLDKYPAEVLAELWQDLCLCQFHDVIPGSSIARVYQEAGEMLESVISRANSLSQKAGAALLRKEAESVTFFNPSSTDFDGLVDCVADAAKGVGVALIHVPAHSFVTHNLEKLAASAQIDVPVAPPDEVDHFVLENALVRYELDRSLRIIRGFDKTAGREFIVPQSPGNVIRIYDDHPADYDAWDFDEYAQKMPVAQAEDVSVEIVTGDIRCGLVTSFKIGKSLFTQKIWLVAGSKRLDFVTDVEWNEKHKLCRVHFPVEVESDDATFEIQYGTIKRKTNDNTKWQYAQFECVGHRYADLSDNQFGVALLNDSKYGYRVKGSELSLSLLRAPTEPDPFADRGDHHFIYSIMPHDGMLAHTDEVLKAAAEINQGLVRFDGFAQKAEAPARLPISICGEGIDLAVLKKAEDSGALIVRLSECRGNHAECTISYAGDSVVIATPCLATELADTAEPIAMPAVLSFRPFEIKTLRLSEVA